MRFTRTLGEVQASHKLSLVDYWLINEKLRACNGAVLLRPMADDANVRGSQSVLAANHDGDNSGNEENVLWHPRRSSTPIRKRSTSTSIRPATVPSRKLAPARKSRDGSWS